MYLYDSLRYQTYKRGGGFKYTFELGVALSYFSTSEILH